MVRPDVASDGPDIGLDEDREGSEVIGKTSDGETLEDPTGGLEAPKDDLDDEERLRRAFDGRYLVAEVILAAYGGPHAVTPRTRR